MTKPVRFAHAARWTLCLLMLALASLLHSAPPPAQMPVPVLTIDEDCNAFAFAPDGRIAYAVHKVMTVRGIYMQRDDIWVTTPDGKKKRIVNGERLVQSAAPFSYAVQSIRWSPDGHFLTVEMFTSVMTDQRGNKQEGQVTLLLDETGKEIKIQGADSVIPESWNGAWLSDGVTVGYLTEAVKPRLLFSLNTVRPVAGRGTPLFEKSLFAALAWDAKRSMAVAVERDAKLSERPRLVLLDIAKQTRQQLAEIPGFFGNLVVSPSGKKVAYYADVETIEVRQIDQPEKATRIRIAYGTFIWGPDENRLLLKRGTAKKTADFQWVRLPDGETTSILSGLTFRDFEISPDGKYLALTVPGKRIIHVIPLP